MATTLSEKRVRFGKAMADETRQQIMHFCCCRWRAVTEIARAVGVTQPTASHHLALLNAAGLVKTRRERKLVYYTLDQSQVATCCGQLMTAFAPEDAITRRLKSL